MAHARPMHAGYPLGVRESQFLVFSGSSSAEDLLASLDDFPLVAPQPYLMEDALQEDVIRELQHSELPIHREHVLLSDERDYLDHERFSPKSVSMRTGILPRQDARAFPNPSSSSRAAFKSGIVRCCLLWRRIQQWYMHDARRHADVQKTSKLSMCA